MSRYEQVTAKTVPIEATFYVLLDTLDQYGELLKRLMADEQTVAEPNERLIDRFRQFASRAESMTKILEDDVLTEMLWLIDRLHAVKDTEDGTFI